MMKSIRTTIALLAVTLMAVGTGFSQQSPFKGGRVNALDYSGYNFALVSDVAAASASSQLVPFGVFNSGPAQNNSCIYVTPSGRQVLPFGVGVPITVNDGSNSENVVLTAVTSTNNICNVTGTFTIAHSAGTRITSASKGLAEAVKDVQSLGGGVVAIGPDWTGTNAQIVALTPYSSVAIVDDRGPVEQYWNLQTGLTTLAAPATLTAATVGFGLNGANTTGGTYTGTSTYVYCIAYVDIMGQEGPCSATFSAATAGTGATNQIGFSAPAASTGAVGYTVYISLASGSYALAYKVPLVSQPTVAGAPAVSNSVCTLTQVETITPACAVTNTTYGQTGSAAIVSALTLNTSPIDPQITTVSSTTVYTPNAGGRTTAVYTPSSHLAVAGLNASFLPFAISAAEATTVPSVIGTINVQPQFMNYVGRTLEICGKATTTASTATIVSIQFQWDSMGMNTAGKGVQIGNLSVTPVAAFSTTKVITFCETFQTTVAGVTATAGSINSIGGFIATSGVASAAAGQAAGSDASIGTTALLNLAADARINVISVHTTGTDGAAFTLQSLTARTF